MKGWYAKVRRKSAFDGGLGVCMQGVMYHVRMSFNGWMDGRWWVRMGLGNRGRVHAEGKGEGSTLLLS